MTKVARLLALYIALPMLVTPLQVTAQCRLCTAQEQESRRAAETEATPLRVTIEANIRFSRLALNGHSGEAMLDENSGVTGEAGRNVRIDLPDSVRMVNQAGERAELVNLRTNLPARPRLNLDGELSFRFSGTLRVNGSGGGNYRGRIPITAEYE
jgi:hypothetical protein